MKKVFLVAAATMIVLCFVLPVPTASQVAYGIALGSGSPNSGITPALASFETGNSSNYVTSTAGAPYFYQSLWEGTPAPTTGGGSYVWFADRIDAIVEPSTDVASGVGFASEISNYGTNSRGYMNDGNVTMVAGVFNCSMGSASASGNCGSVNSIHSTYYSGGSTQLSNGFQDNPGNFSTNTPGWFQTLGHPYISSFTAVSRGQPSTCATPPCVGDATFAFGADGSDPSVGYLAGFYSAAARNFAYGVLANGIYPDTGLWISAAKSWGIYIGCNSLYTVNPGEGPSCDTSHNPAVGLDLAWTATSSGPSNKLRFEATDGGGTSHAWDFFQTSDQNQHVQFGGADRMLFGSNGNFVVAGDFILGLSTTNYVALQSASPTAARTATFPDGTGTVLLTGNGSSPIQTKRGVAGCATAASAGATCTKTVTWTTAFADANYTVTGCTGNGISSGLPIIQGITAKVAASITVQTIALSAAAAQFTDIECGAVHD